MNPVPLSHYQTYRRSPSEGQAFIVDDDEIDGQYDLYMHPIGGTDWQVVDNWGGIPGPQGPTGPAPAGGAVGQIISKTGTANDQIGWVNPSRRFGTTWPANAGQIEQWKKIASLTVKNTQHMSYLLTLHVTNNLSNAVTPQAYGVLTASVRVNTPAGSIFGPDTQLRWEYMSGLNLTDFVLAYSSTVPGVVELWVNDSHTGAYGYTFDVVTETVFWDSPAINAVSTSNIWTLHDDPTVGNVFETPTEGYTQVISKDMTYTRGYDNAGSHNAIYRGKFLGNTVTDAQYAAIAAGTFDDLYIGDYWTIGDSNWRWRIAAFDYYYRVGDVELTKHHVTIVPDTNVYTAQMNDTDIIAGAYIGSLMRTANLEQAKTIINNAFPGHVLTHRQRLSNAASSGRVSGVAWVDASVEIMSEYMVYGTGIFTPAATGTSTPSNYFTSKSQLPLFGFRPDLISNRLTYWLRDINSDPRFVIVGSGGDATTAAPTYSTGVRPSFSIIGEAA